MIPATQQRDRKGFVPVHRTVKRPNNDEWEYVYDSTARDYVARQVGVK